MQKREYVRCLYGGHSAGLLGRSSEWGFEIIYFDPEKKKQCIIQENN